MGKQWSNDELDLLKNNYGKISTRELSKLFINRSMCSINGKASKLSIKGSLSLHKKAKVNDNFFSEYTALSCYYAGLIASDGCIREKRGLLVLSQKDKSILEKFKETINYNGNITRTYSKVTSKLFKDKNKRYECFHIRITSRQIVDDLRKNFNIVQNKTLILNPPPITNDYFIKCFITGLIDGDGWIGTYLQKNGITPYLKCALTGTLQIGKWVQEKFNGIGYIRHPLKGYNPIICQYNWGSKSGLKVMKELLSIKELENVRFARKWDKINSLTPIREKKKRNENRSH